MEASEIFELRRRVADLERRVTDLDQGGRPAPPPTVDPEIYAELQRGNKIGAIKRYREMTGAGLAEAKNAVEALESGIRLQ